MADSEYDKPEEKAFSALYAAYAAGCLDPAFALLVETQSALRTDIANDVARAEIIAGSLLEQQPPVEMSDRAIDRAMAAIDAFDTDATYAVRAAEAAGGALDELLALPEPLRTHVLDSAGSGGWKFSAPGLRRLPIDIDSAAEVELYRIAPGASVPRHSHDGAEYTLVVSGGFTDETGSYGPGDVAVKGPDDTHQPVGDAGEPCFALAVRDGGLRFTGVAGVLQRVIRT